MRNTTKTYLIFPSSDFEFQANVKMRKKLFETSEHLKLRWIKSWNRKTSNLELSMAKAKTKAKNYEKKRGKNVLFDIIR